MCVKRRLHLRIRQPSIMQNALDLSNMFLGSVKKSLIAQERGRISTSDDENNPCVKTNRLSLADLALVNLFGRIEESGYLSFSLPVEPRRAMCFHLDYQTLISIASSTPLNVRPYKEQPAHCIRYSIKTCKHLSYKNRRPSDAFTNRSQFEFVAFLLRLRKL